MNDVTLHSANSLDNMHDFWTLKLTHIYETELTAGNSEEAYRTASVMDIPLHLFQQDFGLRLCEIQDDKFYNSETTRFVSSGPIALGGADNIIIIWMIIFKWFGIWEYGRGDLSPWPRDTIYPQKLALTSPTSGGRSVCIVRLQTQATELEVNGWYIIKTTQDFQGRKWGDQKYNCIWYPGRESNRVLWNTSLQRSQRHFGECRIHQFPYTWMVQRRIINYSATTLISGLVKVNPVWGDAQIAARQHRTIRDDIQIASTVSN
jgi:hypothetical protein